MESKTEAKLLGLQMAMALKSQQPIDIAPLQASIAALAEKVNGGTAIHADTVTFDVNALAEKFEHIAAYIQAIAQKDTKEDLSGIAAAIDSVYQAMPEYDLGEITAAIQDAPDVRPELQAIVSAIGENTVAVRENTAAIEKQNQILMRKRRVTLDAEGRIKEIEVI